MKKTNILKFIFLFMFIISSSFIKVYGIEENNDSKIILIDPGHGGFDGGAVSKRGTIEKDINLSISKKINDRLKENRYKVYMTREEDISLHEKGKSLKEKKVEDLKKRCSLKIETNCDLFISIHQNMFTDSRFFGAQVWYSDYKDSEVFANIMQKHLKDEVDNNNKRLPKAAKDSYRILRDKYEKPCIILECGFLSNPKEEEKLKDEEYQNKIAEAVVNSINEYFNRN